MLGWKDVTMKEEQHKDLLRQAEHRALIRHALEGRERRTRLGWNLPTRLARRLIILGSHLIERFAEIAGRFREPGGSRDW